MNLIWFLLVFEYRIHTYNNRLNLGCERWSDIFSIYIQCPIALLESELEILRALHVCLLAIEELVKEIHLNHVDYWYLQLICVVLVDLFEDFLCQQFTVYLRVHPHRLGKEVGARVHDLHLVWVNMGFVSLLLFIKSQVAYKHFSLSWVLLI